MLNKGFTLIELLIVITIIAALLGLGLAVGPEILEGQRIEATKNLIKKIDLALIAYKQQTQGGIPSAGPLKKTNLLRYNLVRTGVVDFNDNEVNDSGEIIDPWGTPMRYDPEFFGKNNPNILIMSFGPDRTWDANKNQDDPEFERDDISNFDGLDD